ncbi:MAG: acyltransferase [Clostridia bacterium]|nr:acyltransferase [Clostridia bacterium]
MKRFLLRIFRSVSKNDVELRKLGAQTGDNFNNYGYIDSIHCNLLSVGNDVTIASGAKLEFHDASTKHILGYSKFGRIKIGNNVFIGANSIVMPNVEIGDNVVIGAGSVVISDIASNSVAAGNPCKVIKTYEAFVEKNTRLFESSCVYEKNYNELSEIEKQEQLKQLKNGGIAFDK